jgi:hypothetical protein
MKRIIKRVYTIIHDQKSCHIVTGGLHQRKFRSITAADDRKLMMNELHKGAGNDEEPAVWWT